ncbi:MAG: DUF2079 domain-containing protein [Chloroflexi bacterium]|nr:DUF2079 domain-containing protein [Chloroflexota bacterium]
MKRFTLRLHLSELTLSQIAWMLLLLSMLVYSIVISYETVLRYDTFKATAFDLGNYDQAIWNTIHGRLFQFTNQGDNWYGPPTRLAIHFEPIILPLSLLYAFHADPRILLVFQTLALAAGALPVFLLTRNAMPAWPLLAPVMAITYLLMPALLGMNLFDFHPLSLATPLLLYAVLALTYKRYIWFLITCVLAAACKEDVPVAIALLGVLVVWKYKLPRLGITLIIGGILWSVFGFLLIKHFFPGAQGNNYWYRYEALGISPGAAIINLLEHPWLIFTTFITLDRVYYLAGLLRSTGFLALLAPEWLLPAVFSLAVNMLSVDDPLLYSGVYQYNAAIIPFIMIAAIYGTQRFYNLWQIWRGEPIKEPAHVAPTYMQKRHSNVKYWGALPALLAPRVETLVQNSRLAYASISRAVVAHPAFTRPVELIQPRLLSLSRVRNTQWQRFGARMTPLASRVSLSRLQWTVCVWIIAMLALNFFILTPMLNIFWPDHPYGSREQHIEQLLAMIPPDASVSAGGTLNPHLTERLYVTVFPAITFISNDKNIKNTVQYVIVDLDTVFPEDKVSTANEINRLVSSKQFRILARAEGVILLIRRASSLP